MNLERARWFRLALRREGTRDRRRLEREEPRFVGLAERILQKERELEAAWLDYTTNVSRAEISCTLGGAAVLAAIAEVLEPRAVLDLGSGFSSYVFRAGGFATKSVDDDPAWLERTQAFLASRSIGGGELVSLSAIGAADHGAYELVFYDLGSMSTREQHLELALACARPGTAMVLDDCHKARYWKHAEAALTAHASAYYSLRAYACDVWGRFSVLAFKR